MNLQYILDSKGQKTGVFIPIEDWEKLKSYIKEIQETEDKEPSKAEIVEGIKEALQEVNQHQEGKIKLNPARELLDEL
jgi:lipoate-protein ligase A